MRVKILLVSLNLSGYHSLALAFLASYLLSKEMKNHLELKIKNIPLERFEIFRKHLINFTNDFKPDVIGFSCYAWNFAETVSLCTDLKKIVPNTLVVLGGPQVSDSEYAHQILMKNPDADIIVRNEGEVTFSEIIRNLVENSQDFSNILGITYRKKNEVIANSEQPPLTNLDEIPSPYLSGVYEKYIANENTDDLHFFDEKLAIIETSRGCMFRCAYCLYARKPGHTTRYFSFERIREDLLYLVTRAKSSNYILFSDKTMNDDKKRLIQLCDLLAGKEFANTELFLEIRPEILDEEVIEHIGKIRNVRVELGLQTTNSNSLFLIHRGFNPEKYIKVVNSLQSRGITTMVDLITGLPQDNLLGFKESLGFVLEEARPDSIPVIRLRLYPGTELYMSKDKYHFTFEEITFKIMSNDTWTSDDLNKADAIGKTVENILSRKIFLYKIFALSWPREILRKVFKRWSCGNYSINVNDIKILFDEIIHFIWSRSWSY